MAIVVINKDRLLNFVVKRPQLQTSLDCGQGADHKGLERSMGAVTQGSGASVLTAAEL